MKQIWKPMEYGVLCRRTIDGNTGHWWKVDLGDDYSLTGSKITFEFAHNYQYIIEVSQNDASWTTVPDCGTSGSSDQIREDAFNITARYLRVTITGLAPDDRAGFFECEVYAE